MTRFLITIDQAVDFVISSAEQMVGGEIFIPRMPSVTITDLAKAIAPDARWEFIGIRPGEKLHETLLMSDEARHTIEKPDRFVVLPEFRAWMRGDSPSGEPLPDGFTYGSDSNSDFLDVSEIADLVEAGMKGLVEPRPDDIVIRAEEVAPQTAS